ncbi:hypothetical protein CBR_g3060 [Chara braunii]|uniref:Small-subunit processome Utp12 domain-containing protein n=1 Tax=Chara braunii TaxID=69332 RepID=A0A388KET8_CHABU|nr:hypothetical protein CBR_g3060 [Chara braunii]|eukprot:GBG68516.1 hypothetical protein CBR_g3060 [Chara braunii]
MVKAYLRYEASGSFGVIASSASNITYDASGKLLVSPALENAILWNIKQGASIRTLSPTLISSEGAADAARPEVTCIVRSPTTATQIAVGYADGSIRIWDILKGSCEVLLNGHKSAVTALRYNASGEMLASGAKDTDVIIWDVGGEAGLFRLRGHRDQVTDVVFLERSQKVVSCSKDTFVRVWDLNTQLCVQTVVGHRSEVWSVDVDPEETRLITGSTDVEMRVYSIIHEEEEEEEEEEEVTAGIAGAASGDGGLAANGGMVMTRKGALQTKWNVLRFMGGIRRQATERAVMVRFNATGRLLACQAAGKTLEVYRIRAKDEVMKKAKRRKKRKRAKAELKQAAGREADDDEEENYTIEEDGANVENEDGVAAQDEIVLLQVLRLKQKVRSFAFSPGALRKNLVAEIALSLSNNSLEVYDLQESGDCHLIHAIELAGHRSDVRALALSSDDSLLLSTSNNAIKIWNPRTCSCLRTMESGYGLSALFVPGNRQGIVGTKEGHIEIVDIAASQRISQVEAHTGAVWSVAPIPDGSGFVSGSADHDVKFWEYELIEDKAYSDKAKRLNVRNVRTLKMPDDVLCVRLSPDGKFIAAALLDTTIKIFFADSLKFFLSLYGHKLPVLSMDISSDGALLASGSADKNLKIWGMDFGDCHRSLFAHQESVMQVAFVRGTHYVFTVGKDKVLKYWDADKFELLLTLEGHHAEVWCLAVSSHGDFVVTGSHDRSIRRWERTEEPFYPEEEREKRMEQMFEAGGLEDGRERGPAAEEIPEEGVTAPAGKRTQETVSSADAIIEALDMAESEIQRLQQHEEEKKKNPSIKPLPPNALMLGLSPSAYVLRAVAAVRTSDLEQALLIIPFNMALRLMSFFEDWLKDVRQVELTSRTAVILFKLHHQQLTATSSARRLLTSLQGCLRGGVQALKDVMGYNIAAMGQLQHMLEERSAAPFTGAEDKLKEIRERLAKGREHMREERKQRHKKSRLERKKMAKSAKSQAVAVSVA